MPRMKMSDLDVVHPAIDRVALGSRLNDAVLNIDQSVNSLKMMRDEASAITFRLALDRVADLISVEAAKINAIRSELQRVMFVDKIRKKRRKKRAAE